MLNTLDVETTKSAVWKEIPQLRIRSARCFRVRNVWTNADLGCVRDKYAVKLASHDTAVLLVTDSCAC